MMQNFFLFGSGFTKSVFQNAPLNDTLLDELLKVNSLSPLHNLSRKFETKDIENLLTRLDIDLQLRPQKYENNIRKQIEGEIAYYFQKFRFQNEVLSNNSWLNNFATKVFHKNDTIVNLNYDCFLEGLLDYFEVWSPQKGYGWVDNILVDRSISNPKDIKMLKIHGSENFTSILYEDNPDSSDIIFEFSKEIFPHSALNSCLGPLSLPMQENGQLEGIKSYVIAPSFVKIPSVKITYLMLDALEAVKKSKMFFIIGCGLRHEDNFLWLLLTSFLHNPEWEKRKIVIVSPDAEKLSERIKRFWGVPVANNIIKIPHKLEEKIDDLVGLL
jgi:hypothetical protein